MAADSGRMSEPLTTFEIKKMRRGEDIRHCLAAPFASIMRKGAYISGPILFPLASA